MTDEPIITPHPEVESLSNVELRHALANADERLELLHKLPPEDRDPMVEAWLVQERQLILAELRRRYAHASPSDSSEQFVNLTSDYRNPLSEVKFEREVNAAVLQAVAIAQGIPPVMLKPLLGKDGYVVKGWSHLVAAFPKTGKTELMVRALADWPDDKVLYVTEEPKSVWQARLLKLPSRYHHLDLFFGLGGPAGGNI